MIIFFDWDSPNGSSGPQDGQSDHVGIVVGVDESRVYTVEGNSGNDACNYKSYPRGSSVIRGYGMKSLVMVFPPIKQDAVLPGGILLNTNFLRICSFLLCKHPYKFYLKIVSKKLLRDDL